MDANWRDFRARLVEQELKEKQGEGAGQKEGEEVAGEPQEGAGERGWAYATPLIEMGSLLLSAPGDHFAINQQYFHKTVIFIVEHTDQFTRGVILNRPTAFTTGDLRDFALSPELELPQEFLNGTDRWNVWCGGDCQGLNSRKDPMDLLTGGTVYYCLHALERLSALSTEMIIKGVFMIELTTAQRLVAQGEADKEDFLLLVGYCGWGPGQLQGELDRGDTWTMAAADQRVLLGRLREAQAALTVRLEAASGGGRGMDAGDVGDGLADWEQLYRALGPEFSRRLDGKASAGEDGEEGGAAGAGEDEEASVDDASLDEHTDEMLRRWINRCLIPPRLQAKPEFPSSPAALSAASSGTGSSVQLSAGTIIRGSATAWLLGKPAESPSVDASFSRQPPGQYLHKAVLLLLRDYATSDPEPSLLVLVNGPKVGWVQNESDAFNVYFGGPHGFGSNSGVFEMKGPTPYRFQGMVSLAPGLLEELVEMGALEVATDMELDSVLAAPLESRWEVAGGRLETLEEASTARLGDLQRRKWYKRFLDLDLSGGA